MDFRLKFSVHCNPLEEWDKTHTGKSEEHLTTDDWCFSSLNKQEQSKRCCPLLMEYSMITSLSKEVLDHELVNTNPQKNCLEDLDAMTDIHSWHETWHPAFPYRLEQIAFLSYLALPLLNPHLQNYYAADYLVKKNQTFQDYLSLKYACQ